MHDLIILFFIRGILIFFNIVFYFNREKTLNSPFNEPIHRLKDKEEENQHNTQAGRMKLQKNIMQIRDELIEDDIKKMKLMKNYHQEIRNSLRFRVDEQNETQITQILEKFDTFEQNFEIIIKRKQKYKELKTNGDNSHLVDLQQDLQQDYEETQRHYREIQRLLQPIIQSNDEIKQSIERLHNDVKTGFKEIEKKGPKINVGIRANDIETNTLTIADPKTVISNSTSISKPDFEAQPVIEEMIPDKTATIASKDVSIIITNEKTIISTPTLLPQASPDVQPIRQEMIRGQHATDESQDAYLCRCSLL